MSKINSYLIGSDPELFIRNKNSKKIISSIGLIPGLKGDAYKPEHLSEGYGLQIDNILAEFNIPPTNDKTAFIESMNVMKNYISDFIKAKDPELEIYCYGSAIVDKDQLLDPQALEFGCSPDFNAWTKDMNPAPEGAVTQLRTTGCHFHIGYDEHTIETSMELIKTLDLFLGVPSILIDPDDRRRELYGKAGCFRPTSYGVEYRSLSGFFLSSDDLIGYCFDQIERAIMFINEGYSVEEDEKDILECINNNNKDVANKLIQKYNLPLI